MKIFKNGLITWLILQVAIGPVFFFIINLTLQKTILDGFAGVMAVTIVDYLYITLAILGIGKLLERKKIKKVFAIISSIILIIFGLMIIKNITSIGIINNIDSSSNLWISFISVFFLTISSPMTIVFFTSLFATKAIEYNYNKNELLIFWLATGLATFLFMWTSVILFYLLKWSVPILLIQILNLLVGCLLIWYGTIRLIKIMNKNNFK